MAVLKCKMCGGDIQPVDGAAYGTCGSCGTTSTLPKASDERIANLFNRANHFRQQNEFDKAAQAYENILNEDNSDAEAHWGLVLSRYGIEYVEDPRTRERVPTCRRVQFDPILSDPDYLAALEYAGDEYSKSLYAGEAKRISDIQKGILAISSREEPCDVFICYKETTDGGNRTKDSAIAQDIYYELTNGGYRVFFAKITLEDKLGQEYEPYIFSALNSAKVMLVIGTRKEYFEAVWVKNEWSRYLALMKKDRSRLLIPCYRDMDAYDIPDELSNLQSQDMSKIGFMQDILRGVRKILDAGKQAEKAPAPAAAVAAVAVDSIERLVKNGNTLLKLNNRAGAQDIFNTATKEYPDDYRGWLGLARCATANFTAPAENEAAVNMWLGYVKQLANENEFAVVEKEIVEYMKKMAENDADNDMGTVNYIINDIQTTQISSLVTQKEQIEKNMECRKQEYHREIADDEITFDSMANTSRQKKKLRVVIGSLIGVVLLIAIMVDVELFAGLIIILMFIVIPFALLYHFIKNRNRVQQRDEDEITIIAIGREKRKNYEKAIAIFNEHINALNTEIKRAETRIACCQKYISADKTKIAEMFLAQRCAKIGIQRQYDEALAKLRSAASDPNGQFEEFVEKSEDGVEAEESFESFPRREWGLNQRAKFHLGS